MASGISFFLLAVLLSSLHPSAAQSIVRAAYWFPESEFPVSSINSSLFTHLFCAFADVDPNSYRVTIASSKAAAFSTFTSTVRRRNPSVSTLLSIGGGGNPSPEPIFAAMASGAASRRAFIDSSIQLARANGFSGLDLDWEYPRTGSDMSNLGTLLREWRAAVNAEATSTGRPRLLLTAAVYYSSVLNSEEYPAATVASSLDWINVMSYDYYTPSWRRVTSAHAALYDASSQLSTSAGIGDWTSSGVPSRKIVMGIPFYGYAWKLLNPANNGLGAPATNGTTGDGSIAYNQIRAFIRNNAATRVYDGNTVANYCYAGTTWIGYVDVEAIDDMMTYARDNRLLGYFAWSVSGDENWVLSQRGGCRLLQLSFPFRVPGLCGFLKVGIRRGLPEVGSFILVYAAEDVK
ncbi:hypothetical protein Taro_030230 [Colocasia esculenta]|uniref:GH18 domain-containing protein n=1 Tax=Colocasia esculenta TaxID=4460 RepID=A0A843VLY4_COLES|nr:hypothetical protein [Colocasia esculenta]